jgi:tRNA (guanine37-N1)-methyltransferase
MPASTTALRRRARNGLARRAAHARPRRDPRRPRRGRAGTTGQLLARRDLLHQAEVRRIATGAGAILLCVRYEGVDQRFIDAHVDVELSVGDYVLSGGELPALILLDAIARLQPGVLGDARSHEQDSFSAGLLDFPHYSRPERLGGDGAPVPEVLLGGNHGAIDAWRREQSLALTAARRPDLIAGARAQGLIDARDEAILARHAAAKL